MLALIVTASIITQGQAQETRQNQASPDTVSFRFERKSPTGALFRSLFVPGWGQLYTERYVKSAVVFLGEGSLIGLAAYEWNQMNKYRDKFESEPDLYLKDFYFRNFELHESNRNTYLWFLAGAVFISMWDAYVDAHLYNFKEQTKELDLMGGVDEEGRVRVGVAWRF